jgi:phosphohistidine phosphatase SixA
VTIHLIRHGSAGRRTALAGDAERELDETGLKQSRILVDRLADAGIQEVLTSPAMRCRQTVEPLAVALRGQVIVNAALQEGQSPARARGLVQRLAAGNVSAALCSHADIIPSLLRGLAASGVLVEGTGCAKASVWTLAVTDGRVTHATYHPTS